jgi:hypothetical protein
VYFTLRTTHAGFAEAMRWHFAPFRRPGEFVLSNATKVDLFVQDEDALEDPPFYSYFLGESLRARVRDVSAALALSVNDLQHAIPQSAHDFVFLHAGAVASRQGAILMPAASDSGKSSLTLALLSTGFEYLSDEYAAIDPITTRAYPVPKRIGLDASSFRWFPNLDDETEDRRLPVILPNRFVTPEEIGSRVAGPSEVRALIFPTTVFEGPPRLVPVQAAEAVEQMARNHFNMYRYRDLGTILLGRVASQADRYRVEGGAPAERAELIAERFAS